MEREVRDVLSALAGCVAMRCAAEKNIDDIANMEVGRVGSVQTFLIADKRMRTSTSYIQHKTTV